MQKPGLFALLPNLCAPRKVWAEDPAQLKCTDPRFLKQVDQRGFLTRVCRN